MLSKPIRDCGCGGGTNCITKHKKQFRAWVAEEMKRLDCGCGCKGKKKFEQKYGKLVGGKLKDCPPGWRNDGLTCVENCRPDEFDDGLTCRKKCESGYVDDGLTCRKPITSSIDPCPDGSTDVAGTCWGPVRQDCIDDCFKHPAPGCRTYECGRLKGLLGEDWGAKLCTDCNLRCGQTCWNVNGITRQLHERNLRLSGGEVILQAIRGKSIQGRVDWDATIAEITGGLENAFGNDSGLAKLFDPEKNGVAAAFRKFGDDTKGAFEEIGRKTKDAFDKMGADAKAAFEKFARDAEGNLTNLLGKEFMDKMKDPKFWIEAAAIMAQVGATILGVLVTAGTLGVGAAAGAAIIMAGNMVAPAIRMIGKAAMGEPIDALDIADMALSAIPAPGPGKAASSLIGKAAQAVIRNGSTIKAIGGLVISGVKAGQALGMIPSSCLGPNCPPPPAPPGPPVPPDPRPPPDMPPNDPPPPGQLSDDEILNLRPEKHLNAKIKVDGVKVKNPDYISDTVWIQRYRQEHYGTPAPPPTVGPGALATPNDVKVDNIPTADPQEPVEIPNEFTLEGDTIQDYVPMDLEEEEVIPFTFDGEGEQEGEQVNALGEVVPEPVPVPAEPPKPITKPAGQPLTDDEILDLRPPESLKAKITVDGKKVNNPKYISDSDWIQQYKANLAKIPDTPPTTGELIAQGVEPIEAVEQVQATNEEIADYVPSADAEEEVLVDEAPEGDEIADYVPSAEAEEEVLFDEEVEEGTAPEADEIVDYVPSDDVEEELLVDEAPVGMVLDEEEEEKVPVGMVIDEDEEEKEKEKELLDTNKYVFEVPGEGCRGHFQEEDLTGGAEGGDEIEPLIEGDVTSNPFGSMKTVKEYPFIPKTHRGTDFIVDCYAAKNPEVATAMNNDPDRMTSHWIEEGAKQGLDADCGPSTTTIEERLAMLQQQEAGRLQREAKKTNCAATDRFWIESEGKCDGRRTANGERRGEAYACEEQGNFWDSDFGYKFCNKLLDVDGKPKSGKEFCTSKNQYWDGSNCDPTKNLDGSPKLMPDLCQDLGVKYDPFDFDTENFYGKRQIIAPWSRRGAINSNRCDIEKDTEGNPIDKEKLCLDTVSYYKDGVCDYKKFPNGVNKPEAMADAIVHHRNGVQIPYDIPSLGDYLDNAGRRMVGNNEDKIYQERRNTWNAEREQIKREAAIEKAKEVLGFFNIDYGISKGFVQANPKSQSFWQESEKIQNSWIDAMNLQWLTDWYPYNMEGTPGVKANLTPAEIDDYRRNFSMDIGVYSKFDMGPSWGDRIYKDPEFMNAIRPFFSRPSKPNFEGKGRGGNKPATLTLHWADWCPHCHDMMPEWKKLGSNHNGVVIQAVEQKRSGFKGPFPTILFQHGNSMEKYEGPRTKAAFAKFLKNKLA